MKSFTVHPMESINVHPMESIIVHPTMPNNNKDIKLHIAMFPWLAFGHMIPYLELAKLIAGKGHKISFISTPRNIDRLPPLRPKLSALITFVKLPLPQNPNLPEGAEATADLPEDQVPHLKNAYDCLAQPISQFLKSTNPDWLLFDFAPYWVPEIAQTLGIPTAFFSIVIATAVTFLGPTSPEIPADDRKLPEDYVVPPKWVPFPATVALRFFEVLRLYKRITGDETNVSDLYRFMETLRGCDLIAVRSCSEFEPEWLSLLRVIHGKPVLPVGLLSNTPKADDENETWRSIKDWLDRQNKNTVVYVAFGTEAMPSQEEATEIALGLEKSGSPFFWVLRTKHGDDAVKLPEGFEERNEGRGVVCRRWAPQVKILAHDSVGVFLSHSGWSSVVEALTFGRPLVLLPMSNDQGLNARYFGEKKVGYELRRNDQDGSFTSEAVAESLRMVMEKEEGRVYRDKAQELKPLFGDWKRQNAYVDKFLEYLKTHRGCKTT
ncbi:putative soyasaponin III rhamnosyltransferase [Rosa chinensis]|uniref:Glycosyltransferase n=1 Tax=Rosa chinensis TaxID=74649 RepID=A0A2P6RPW1_ROSCH|nr:UDP-glycosyltransferase 91A1 [Rosa chinensis]PRQ48450.1 putative soyasaponin III rhamnosyltransferase [Rosa chinensis]